MTTPSLKRRWFQYSLRTLLVLMLLASIGMSWIAVRMQKAKKQQEAVEAIRKAGGQVYYFQDEQDSDGNELVGEESPRGVWLQSLVGKARVFQVSFSDTTTEAY